MKRLILLLALLLSAATASASPPHILLVLSDDHSYPHLGCYGNKNIQRFDFTPNFDQFASQGMRFDRFLAAQAIGGSFQIATMDKIFDNLGVDLI